MYLRVTISISADWPKKGKILYLLTLAKCTIKHIELKFVDPVPFQVQIANLILVNSQNHRKMYLQIQ